MSKKSSSDKLEKYIDEISASMDVPKKQSKDVAWANIQEGIQKKQKSSIKIRLISYSSAAALLILMLSFVLFSEERIQTLNAEIKNIELPDGSQVHLNAESEITYNRILWNFTRKLSLKGEAFFEVKKGRRFLVKTDQGQVQVLGTRFNVYARDKRMEVKCESGKVRVSNSLKESIEIVRGESVKFKKQSPQIVKQEFNLRELDWNKGQFVYNNESLHNVIKELERQFSLRIIFPDQMKERKFSGEFSNDDLESALMIVCLPMNFQYKIKKDSVIISSL